MFINEKDTLLTHLSELGKNQMAAAREKSGSPQKSTPINYVSPMPSGRTSTEPKTEDLPRQQCLGTPEDEPAEDEPAGGGAAAPAEQVPPEEPTIESSMRGLEAPEDNG